MMVDDHEDQIYSLEIAFNELFPWEYEFISLHSGVECFKWLEHNESPDIIILDIHLPDKNGFEIFDEIRANAEWVDIPIIFLSGDSKSNTLKEVGDFFADAFIEKPVEVSEFKKIVDRLTKK